MQYFVLCICWSQTDKENVIVKAAFNACSDDLYLSSDHAAILYRDWE